ncbi:DNA -methyltransferase 1 protein [Marine Group I thaumarchaeote SCGC RSA3]|uniref:DNA (cytosine-5-)-methyltransferase n=1 Tax=Marine Group I thaumarchaeote SCGC RSA3 TaxID=1503183 RepID=A0A087RXX9_9ARCH|nr:DNA -methyltransferase 1 protein [Marine Group I thaumarchaeote SCGC RSA3]
MKNSMKGKKPTVIELFAGAGGMALGLEKAGFETKMLVEYDKDCVATLRKNRPKWNVIHDDIHEISFKGMNADVVTGGFPCQAFSHAGHKLGFRSVKEIRPKIFLAENVEAILRNQDGKTIETIMDVLGSFGYDVRYEILNAVDYNVAQKRKRVIFIGTKKGVRFQYPKPSKKKVTLGDALKDVPKSEGSTYSDEKIKLLKHVPAGGSWVDMPVDVQKKYMGKSFYSTGGRRGMGRRIAWDEPCLTLTCSPGQKMTERCHPVEVRPFTIREYARIQSFPDSWKFVGSISSRYKQIGNAVPVNLAKAVAKELVKSLLHPKLVATVKVQSKIKDFK